MTLQAVFFDVDVLLDTTLADLPPGTFEVTGAGAVLPDLGAVDVAALRRLHEEACPCHS